jgi:hypothetical protein
MLHSEKRSVPLIRTNLFLSTEQRDTLFSLAATMDISAAELARRILDKGLKRAVEKQTEQVLTPSTNGLRSTRKK